MPWAILNLTSIYDLDEKTIFVKTRPTSFHGNLYARKWTVEYTKYAEEVP